MNGAAFLDELVSWNESQVKGFGPGTGVLVRHLGREKVNHPYRWLDRGIQRIKREVGSLEPMIAHLFFNRKTALSFYTDSAKAANPRAGPVVAAR